MAVVCTRVSDSQERGGFVRIFWIAAIVVSAVAAMVIVTVLGVGIVSAQTATATATATPTASPAATPAGTATAAPTLAACPSGVTITVAPPTASAPTTVTAAIEPPVNIKAAAAGDFTSFHVHYFVDTPAAAAGTAIPTGNAQIIHS